MSEKDDMAEIHRLYCKAFKICQRACDQGNEYIGFRRRKDNFILMSCYHDNNGQSSARMGLSIADWASNVLYGLKDKGFIGDLPLDEYFDTLRQVGYERHPERP